MITTLGGARLGSGNKMTVELHNYFRSTHDQGYKFRTSMAAGTLVPFLVEIGLPGTTLDIDLLAELLTHPTIGPLFGSYKVQLDVFECPIRLYQAHLHNNKLKIGLNMAQVKLPVFNIDAPANTGGFPPPLENSQINPSCLLAYLGIRGIGYNNTATPFSREFNAIPLLAYWDCYKQYYANKQEEIGAVIHTPIPEIVTTVDTLKVDGDTVPIEGAGSVNVVADFYITAEYTFGDPTPIASQIMLNTSVGTKSMEELCTNITTTITPELIGYPNTDKFGNFTVYSWRYRTQQELIKTPPEITTFPLDNIDQMRTSILTHASMTPFDINTVDLPPYNLVLGANPDGTNYALSTQEGLGLKTYQSDKLNNWMKTEWIDGPGGISEVSSIDVSGGTLTIDAFLLAKKVYDMLMRIGTSGGTYQDWIEAAYTPQQYYRCESPIYHGGLIKELVFQEVISNSASDAQNLQGKQPLGTLAGKGTLSSKHKGGRVRIKFEEHGIALGLISITPRIEYSQGNAWHIHLKTMDDFHKPGLDGIGFQDLTTEQMAWWDTHLIGSTWTQRSAGKQPAWIDYMTNVDRTYGNFAIEDDEMFMTLNRRYEMDEATGHIKDLTTYIDPSKFNNIFAQTSLDSQNFWVNVKVGMTSRRLMSAKLMPNL